MTQGDIDKAWSDRGSSIATSTLNAALLVATLTAIGFRR